MLAFHECNIIQIFPHFNSSLMLSIIIIAYDLISLYCSNYKFILLKFEEDKLF